MHLGFYLLVEQLWHHIDDSDVDSFRDSSSDVSSDYNLPKSEIFQRLDQLSLNYQHVLQEGFSSDEGESGRPQSCLSFEYLECNQPWGWEPLTGKILDLVRRFTELKSMKSCALFSSSWLSVAWYPSYRTLMGPTLKDLNVVFYLSFSSYTNHRFVIFYITFVLHFEPVDLITGT
ncbi:hypothetical protein HanHA300_Chr03g0103521 [Helianthus annuus]|nr:hypothetical protein HanHA300_Chr03g0103521 [Helianthus annuus]KAJ0774818.1 hypothetical protein HanOQP8_Chr03g0116171 [Helianthus annuus]